MPKVTIEINHEVLEKVLDVLSEEGYGDNDELIVTDDTEVEFIFDDRETAIDFIFEMGQLSIQVCRTEGEVGITNCYYED